MVGREEEEEEEDDDDDHEGEGEEEGGRMQGEMGRHKGWAGH